MQNKFFIVFVLIFLCQIKTFAIDIIYPKTNGANISANSTFFVGNTNNKNNLYLNGEKIEVFENGSFLKYVPLINGENTFFFEEKNKDNNETLSTLDFKINKITTQKSNSNKTELTETDKIYIATVKQDNIPLRSTPDTNGKRLSHLDANTILILNGRQNDFWRVELSDRKTAWVSAQHICEPVQIENKLTTKLDEIKYETDKNYTYFLYKLKFPVPFIVEEHENTLTLYLFNIDACEYDTTSDQNFIIHPKNDNTLETKVKTTNLWGYDVTYQNGYLIFKIKKAPQTDRQNPLKNIKIVIDAGHGGKEFGAVGPTRVKEKDINLDVAKKLAKILQENGAEVILTRDSDVFTDLYDRVKTAKINQPDFLISLHANALADGANPELKHGTSVFYYHNLSKKFAHTLQAQMLEDLKTKDDGVTKRSFVLTRNSFCPSVLVEMAYMIHPEEYTLLLKEDFRSQIAESIKKGLEKYLLEN